MKTTRRRQRKTRLGYMKTLVVLLLICLVLEVIACAPKLRPTTSSVPIKPILDVTVTEDGGMCLDRDDTERLGIYLLQVQSYIDSHESK